MAGVYVDVERIARNAAISLVSIVAPDDPDSHHEAQACRIVRGGVGWRIEGGLVTLVNPSNDRKFGDQDYSCRLSRGGTGWDLRWGTREEVERQADWLQRILTEAFKEAIEVALRQYAAPVALTHEASHSRDGVPGA